METRKTPLYETHLRYEGRMTDFGGFLLPVQYEQGGVLREHAAVREAAGLFDVSHMGEVAVEGPRAAEFIEQAVTNTLEGMKTRQIRYSPLCQEDGGTVDDLLVYRRGPEKYLLVVNAANRHKDVAFLLAHNPMGAEIRDVSDEIAQLALQGPLAPAILARVADETALPVRYYTFREAVPVAGIPCLVSRTGYTGEDGFELYCPAGDAPALWESLMAAGAADGLLPCGLGARDTLRLEAAMPLYGHELSASITPLEAGLDRYICFDKPDFIGREALLRQREAGVPRRRVGVVLDDRGIAREGARLFDGDRPVGVVTSGTQSPTLRKAVAMALAEPGLSPEGQSIKVEIRGRRLAAETVPLPFYERKRT